MLISNPPKDEEKQTKAMLQFFENVILSFIKDQVRMQCMCIKVCSSYCSNKMKISETNMTFLHFFEKNNEVWLQRINFFSILIVVLCELKHRCTYLFK
jgi:hypothetical protein